MNLNDPVVLVELFRHLQTKCVRTKVGRDMVGRLLDRERTGSTVRCRVKFPTITCWIDQTDLMAAYFDVTNRNRQ